MNRRRRTLLKTLAAVAGAASAGHGTLASAAPAPALSLAGFTALSASLTGTPPANPTIAARMHAAFATSARRAALDRLARTVATTPDARLDAALQAQGLAPLANELVAAWYSGIVATPKGPRVVIYTDALVWPAMAWAKPMGVCGGATGYWADAPP